MANQRNQETAQRPRYACFHIIEMSLVAQASNALKIDAQSSVVQAYKSRAHDARSGLRWNIAALDLDIDRLPSTWLTAALPVSM
jgi:hypothetical protein